MKEEFAKRLTLVRKEKGITQKTAAAELGVSQALLSHYEKGIRECGLEFFSKACEYYDVSADYLLGLSQLRSGEKLGAQLPDPAAELVQGRGSDLAAQLGRRIVFNGVDLLYDVTSAAGSKELTRALNNMLYLDVYKLFRLLYGANPANEQSLFLVGAQDARCYTEAALFEQTALLQKALEKLGGKSPELGQAAIEEKYPNRASGMLNLVKNAETLVKR